LFVLIIILSSLSNGQISVTSFNILDVNTMNIAAIIHNNSVVNYASINPFTITATTNPATIGSVIFNLNGQNTNPRNLFPYTLNGQNTGGNPFTALTLYAGNASIVATPFPDDNGEGTPGTPLSVFFPLITNALTAGTFIGPSILQTNITAGNSVLQMLPVGPTANSQVTELDILFSPLSPITDMYEIRVYQNSTTPGTFTLISRQALTITLPILSIPARIQVVPPVPLLIGQFVAIVDLNGNPLPLPTINGPVQGTPFGLDIVVTGTVVSTTIGSTITVTFLNFPPAWRAIIAPYVPPTIAPTTGSIQQPVNNVVNTSQGNMLLSLGAMIGVIIGGVVLLLIVVIIVVFLVVRRRNREETKRGSSFRERMSNVKGTSPPFRDTTSTGGRFTEAYPRTDSDSVRILPGGVVRIAALREPSKVVWPPHSSEILVTESDIQRPREQTQSSQFERPLCSRCDESVAIVQCVECQKILCHQCSSDLHNSIDSRWTLHSIHELKW